MHDESAPRTAGVAISPPLLYAGAFALGIALGRGTDSDARGARAARTTGVLGLAAGIAIGAADDRGA